MRAVRIVGVVAGLALLAGLTGPSAVVEEPGPPVASVADCPAERPEAVLSRADHPGPLVPSVGAVSVTYCEMPVKNWSRSLSRRDRTLTVGVERMVALLNRLPRRREYVGLVRRQLIAKGEDTTRVSIGEMCTLIGFSHEQWLLVRYRDGYGAAVHVDFNCGTARRGGMRRYLTEKPVEAFLELYRAQVAASRPPKPGLACAGSLPRRQDLLSDPMDGIAVNRGWKGAYLPTELTAALACRYEARGGRLRLVRQAAPTGLDEVRTLLNEAALVWTTSPPGGGQLDVSTTGCGLNGEPAIEAMDVVWVADRTGQVAESRVVRAPCQAVASGRKGPLKVKPPLLPALDAWLAR
ncbi:hypothetical protein [Nonomuraea sp. NPDC050310]|uniref:hypothetical protein n=1 Tax=Nonomuraea sp. NPDC050310 TaxID=3154935 RepID=UPI0033D29AF8